MGDQRRAGDRAAPVDQPHHPFGHPGLVDQFHQRHEFERGQFGRFEHASVAEGECTRQFHRRQRQRGVPRGYYRRHPGRLAADHGQVGAFLLEAVVADLANEIGEKFEIHRRAQDVATPDLGDRHPGVEAFAGGEQILALADQLGDAPQHPLAFGHAGAAPCAALEGGAGGGNGAVDLVRIGFGQLGNHCLVPRADHRQAGWPGAGPAPIDEAGAGFDHSAFSANSHIRRARHRFDDSTAGCPSGDSSARLGIPVPDSSTASAPLAASRAQAALASPAVSA